MLAFLVGGVLGEIICCYCAAYLFVTLLLPLGDQVAIRITVF